MSYRHHEHHHHHPAGHAHPPAGVSVSILRMSIASRLAVAACATVLLWLAVFWVLK